MIELQNAEVYVDDSGIPYYDQRWVQKMVDMGFMPCAKKQPANNLQMNGAKKVEEWQKAMGIHNE